ncbi:hypothetical protein [Hymenobacter terrenus]|uniref:hypothetical protein n=1 Tax=Hymenobacter terrenus TaxID=1629124 RepID=UPI000619544C|nr:hypothetical protein [Hymenobacter terrenus]
MDNNRINALLLRGIATEKGLLADQENYLLLEEDIAPLRTEHAANLAKARDLEAVVMASDADDSTEQKASAKKRLKVLASRLAAALQAHAASDANKDEDLAGRVRYNRTSFTEADDASFATIVTTLLKEAEPLATPLAKREFTPEARAQTEALLARFVKKRNSQRNTAVAGTTDRKTLIALLARNNDLIKKLRVQFKPYQSSPTKHEVWLRFQGYTKVIILGKGGPKSSPKQPPQA